MSLTPRGWWLLLFNIYFNIYGTIIVVLEFNINLLIRRSTFVPPKNSLTLKWPETIYPGLRAIGDKGWMIAMLTVDSSLSSRLKCSCASCWTWHEVLQLMVNTLLTDLRTLLTVIHIYYSFTDITIKVKGTTDNSPYFTVSANDNYLFSWHYWEFYWNWWQLYRLNWHLNRDLLLFYWHNWQFYWFYWPLYWQPIKKCQIYVTALCWHFSWQYWHFHWYLGQLYRRELFWSGQ